MTITSRAPSDYCVSGGTSTSSYKYNLSQTIEHPSFAGRLESLYGHSDSDCSGEAYASYHFENLDQYDGDYSKLE